MTVTGPDSVCITRCGTWCPRNAQLLGIADEARAGGQARRCESRSTPCSSESVHRHVGAAATHPALPPCASPRRRQGWLRALPATRLPPTTTANSTLAAIASQRLAAAQRARCRLARRSGTTGCAPASGRQPPRAAARSSRASKRQQLLREFACIRGNSSRCSRSCGIRIVRDRPSSTVR